MLREKSCGIVPFREVDGEIRYLVISSAVTKREHWEFPKGGVEEGEREIETALRELWEETGVKDVRVLPGYREPIRYIYRRPEGLVSKQVVYFIARVADPAVTLREVEAKDYRWANYEETRRLLRHANARALLERCHAFITGRPLPAQKAQQQRRDGAETAAEAEQRRRAGRRRRGGRPEGVKPAEPRATEAGQAKPRSEARPPDAAPNRAEAGRAEPRRAEAPQRPAAPAPAKPVAAAAAPAPKPERAPAEAGQRPSQRRRRRRRRGGRRQERADAGQPNASGSPGDPGSRP